jgi:RNA-directed DNA polymerase
MSTAEMPVYEWSDLPWPKLEQVVYKLQKRIFQASQRGETKTVHRLQRLLITSRSAKLLAVRKVTQDNRGKKTAGVDGVKNLTPRLRLQLAGTLSVATKVEPVRRVWIPKPGKTERRPLGIPTMENRAAQTLARLALEPEWEARFEPNSFGFRPGRSCHDAIEAVFHGICLMPRFVLDADIAACFDQINHSALLRKLETFPTLRRAIRGWLTAGAWDGVDFKPTEAGTPQGGPLSPLLANIALHGLETHIRAAVPKVKQVNGCILWRNKPIVVRYADDFVVLHEAREVIEQARQVAAEWLNEMGLQLKPEKTRVCHSLEPATGLSVGFDFLGFDVRQHRIGYHRSPGHQGFKTIIKPSKSAQKRHHQKTRELVRRYRTAPQAGLIAALNPVISGWSRYYSTVVSKQVFGRMDSVLHSQLRRWSRRRHPRKSTYWVAGRYWHTEGLRRWVFGRKGEARLRRYDETPIVRHVKVQGDASFYDGDLLYWASRLGRHPELPRSRAHLLKQQKGRCTWCGLLFTTMEDIIEVDHKVPRSRGGINTIQNRQLLHGHCHDAKTASDGTLIVSEVPVTMAIHRGAV